MTVPVKEEMYPALSPTANIFFFWREGLSKAIFKIATGESYNFVDRIGETRLKISYNSDGGPELRQRNL